MTIRVAINGFGRIGRNILRAHYEYRKYSDLQFIAINDLGDANVNAHLLRYDTTHGRFHGDVHVDGQEMLVDGDRIRMISERDPAQLPWRELNVDIVLECTGLFATREKAALHLESGGKKVIISAPAGRDVDATIVYGVNHHILNAQCRIISNASCTTNCLAPVAKVLHDHIGIQNGLMNTIHAYTNDQVLTDVYHTDLRRARSATQSMIPTKTGAAAAVGLVLPELAGKLDGFSVRVPTMNVSVVDFTFVAKRDTSVEEINQLMKKAAKNEMAEVLAYNEEPLVSVDFNHCKASATFDATETRMIDRTVKVFLWYDNEWGFSNRMLDAAHVLAETL